ncbi:hypothetical protein GMSM_15910 [Geomonas sp. Red276]
MNKSLPSYFSVGDGPAVILLHCTLSSKNQWRALASLLQGSHRVIALDLYGYGDTPMPSVAAADFTLADEAELVRALADELLPGERFQLVGHSYGGATALCFSRLFPERVTGVTAFEPVSFHLLPEGDPALAGSRDFMQRMRDLVAAGKPQDAVEAFVDYWGAPGTFAGFPARVRNDFAARAEKLVFDFHAITGTPFTIDDYRELPMPVTVIAGRSSRPTALRVAGLLADSVTTCRLLQVDTGHMGPVNDPERVNPVIAESLSARLEG